jgi:hypothetical protein
MSESEATQEKATIRPLPIKVGMFGVLVEELDASMQLLWGGQGQAEMRIRMLGGR